MALARSSNCGCPNGKGDNTYSRGPHLRVSFPESGIICGRTGCDGSGFVWLTSHEETKYKLGERVFALTGGHAGAKFRVQ
jgi:hypothetical protein